MPLIFAERLDHPLTKNRVQPGHLPKRENQLEARVPEGLEPGAFHERGARMAGKGEAPVITRN